MRKKNSWKSPVWIFQLLAYSFCHHGILMMPDRNNYVPDNVVILYRLCTVCQMDAHNLSVRSVDSPGQKLVMLC